MDEKRKTGDDLGEYLNSLTPEERRVVVALVQAFAAGAGFGKTA